jgi:hypothetical protein
MMLIMNPYDVNYIYKFHVILFTKLFFSLVYKIEPIFYDVNHEPL